MSANESSSFNRTPIYISLALAVLMIVGVLAGAKYYTHRAEKAPVSVTALPAPDAESEQCNSFIGALPSKVAGLGRVDVADPAPAGAAAYSKGSDKQVTIRCGVQAPLQYTELAHTVDVDGTSWLRIDDTTDGSTLKTYYAVSHTPTVAVTVSDDRDPRKDLTSALSKTTGPAPRISDAPLKNLARGKNPADCGRLMSALPDTLADDWKRKPISDNSFTTAWTRDGHEPIVLRCDVAAPPNYGPGKQATQIDNIPWFEDTELKNGSTAATWYALGRSTDIAVNLPQEAGNKSLVALGKVITANTKAQ